MNKMQSLFIFITIICFVSCVPDVEVSVDPALQEITVSFNIINENDKPVDVKLYYFERPDDKHTWCLWRKASNDKCIVKESIDNSIQKKLTVTVNGYYLEYDTSFVLVIDGKAYTGFSEKICTDLNGNEFEFDIVQQNLGWMDLKDNEKDDDIFKGTIKPVKLTEEWNKWGLYYTVSISDSCVDFILDELVY